MDEIVESIGQLSTNAREWTPRQYQKPSPPPSHQSSPTIVVPQASSSSSHNHNNNWNTTLPPSFVPNSSSSSVNDNHTKDVWSSPSRSQSSYQQQQQQSPHTLPYQQQHHQQQQQDYYGEQEEEYGNDETYNNNNNDNNGNDLVDNNNGGGGGSGEIGIDLEMTLGNNMSMDMNMFLHYREIQQDVYGDELPANDSLYKALPPNYTCAKLLSSNNNNNNNNNNNINSNNPTNSNLRNEWGYPSRTFRVLDRTDGQVYCLRRLDNVKCVNHIICQYIQNQFSILPSTSTSNNNNNNTTNNNNQQKQQVRIPHIIPLYKCFQTQNNRHTLYFVHQYLPNAIPFLQYLHHTTTTAAAGAGNTNTNNDNLRQQQQQESLAWTCLHQLSMTLLILHQPQPPSYNLACRCISEHNIYITTFPSLKFHISHFGMPDALEYESRKNIQTLKQYDIYALGKLTLACLLGTSVEQHHHHHLHHSQSHPQSSHPQQQPPSSSSSLHNNNNHPSFTTPHNNHNNNNNSNRMNHSSHHNYGGGTESGSNNSNSNNNNSSSGGDDTVFMLLSHMSSNNIGSRDLYRVLHGIFISREIKDAMTLHRAVSMCLPPRMAMQFYTNQFHLQNKLNDTCLKEQDSGRILRLMFKLAYVNERPEFGIDPRWSETGDCYVLKLFRDYVFHQADESGRPIMDLGHVITALNKLDSAAEEQIVLLSRDGKSMLVVTFANIASCLEEAYTDLCHQSSPPSQYTSMTSSAAY